MTRNSINMITKTTGITGIILGSVFLLLFGCSAPTDPNKPQVIIETVYGAIRAELYPKQAPQTVAAFLRHVDAGRYNQGAFYRVLLQEGATPALNTGLIQGGIWNASTPLDTLPMIPHETTQQSGLSHTSGTLSMARREPGTASSEFFICIGDQTKFDFGKGGDGQGFAAFGKVLEGMDIARKIQQLPANGEQLVKVVEIRRIRRM